MTITIKTHPPSGTVILNRPDQRNALSRQMLTDLAQAFDDLHQERKVRAVILTGAGTAFCAGMDLREMQATSQQADSQAQWHADSLQYRDLLEKMLLFPKPIIAAINGPVVAGGAGLMLASDIVIAAPEATFSLPETRRGIVAGMVAPLLNFRIGGSLAANLLLTARSIDATESHRLGLFHELIKNDLLWARAHEIAGQIAESAPEAIQLTKKMLNETIGEQLGLQLTLGAAASATARTTEAAKEGLAAFLEKRQPKWI